jgi:hypothetical protein
MDPKKYIGMDVHQASFSRAVRDAAGKLIAESIIETKATSMLEFVRGIGGSFWITFEEGTNSAWLLGPIRVALLIGLIQTPHRFRTKRQLSAYCGLATANTGQRRVPIQCGRTWRTQSPAGSNGLWSRRFSPVQSRVFYGNAVDPYPTCSLRTDLAAVLLFTGYRTF